MSQRESGYARKERDLYETPAWVTEALLRSINNLGAIRQTVWEPACGSGKMRDVLASRFNVVSSDIDLGQDFLQTGVLGMGGMITGIITNPPYDQASEFCEHALREMEKMGGFVCMLLRTDFDHAKGRVHLFRDCQAFAKKLVLMKRICWFVEENGKPKASPSFNHAWYIWDWRNKGAPTIAYGP